MRVLLTTDTVGGVWTFTRELAEGLLHAGHAVALVSFGRTPSTEQQEWAKRIQLAFSERFLYNPSTAPLEWMQDNAQALSLAEPTLLTCVSRFQPDILHTSQFCFGSLGVKIPKLITAHSDVLSWAAACRHQLEPSAWLSRYTALVQEGLSQADAVVSPTAQMLRELTRSFTVPCSAKVVFNGRTLPTTPSAQQRMRQAVSVGRLWDKAKGLRTLLEIDSPVPILLAGEEHFEAEAVSTASPKVKSLGVLSERQMMNLYQASSVYIAPSLYEPFGLAPLEAALCGCAVLARDIPSLREVWEDAATYFHSAADLEQQLLALFASPEHLRVSQQKAHRRAQYFTANRITASYIALYKSLIHAKREAIHREHHAA